MPDEPHAGRGEPQLASEENCVVQNEASKGSPLPARHWYHPRNLPHFDASSVTQTITYRLADSLPHHVAERLADELTPDDEPRYRRRIEAYLDAGHGCRCLTTPEIAHDIIDTWRRCDGTRYHLHAWVVMPNHVHVLITTIPGHPLGSIVQSWKSYTGKRIKALTKTTAWQRDYWDRFIRDERHYLQAIDYIHHNPVKAGLCPHPHQWPWSSALGDVKPGEASPSSPSRTPPRQGEQGLASPGKTDTVVRSSVLKKRPPLLASTHRLALPSKEKAPGEASPSSPSDDSSRQGEQGLASPGTEFAHQVQVIEGNERGLGHGG